DPPVDRWDGELERARGDVLARLLERFAGPGALEPRQHLVEGVRALAQRRRLARHGGERAVHRDAHTHGEHEPPTGEVVDRQDLLGQLPGTAAGEREDYRAEGDPLGHRGRGREHPERVERRLGVEALDVQAHTVPGEEPVPAVSLALLGEPHLLRGAPVAADETELHDVASRRRPWFVSMSGRYARPPTHR